MTLSSMKRYTLDILEDDDLNAYLIIPEELMSEAGWLVGDKLEYDLSRCLFGQLPVLNNTRNW